MHHAEICRRLVRRHGFRIHRPQGRGGEPELLRSPDQVLQTVPFLLRSADDNLLRSAANLLRTRADLLHAVDHDGSARGQAV
jgi:hypothetical protein